MIGLKQNSLLFVFKRAILNYQTVKMYEKEIIIHTGASKGVKLYAALLCITKFPSTK